MGGVRVGSLSVCMGVWAAAADMLGVEDGGLAFGGYCVSVCC